MRLPIAALVLIVACATSSLSAEPNWKEAAVPDEWKKAPPGENGFLWYRSKVTVPADWRGQKLELVVEAVDDAREFYFGGQKIGGVGDFPPRYRSGLGETRRLTVPVTAIQFGSNNVVAIRVATIQSRSGFNVAAPVLFAGD